MNPNPRVALVYDRVNTPHGGAEKVLLALHNLFPEAPLFTSVYDSKNALWANDFDVRPSWLQHIPFAQSHHRLLLPFMPLAFESFDLSEFDIVISITSAEAKGVLTQPHQLHLCYLLTPTRYLYSHHDSYLADKNHQLPLIARLPGTGWLAKKVLQYIHWWDQAAAYRPDFFLPISQLVANRATDYYHRPNSTLPPVYPPVEATPHANQPPSLPPAFKNYFLVVSRLVSYKRIDLAIAACQQLVKPLVIVGDGPEKKHLQNMVSRLPNPELVLFLDHQPTAEVQSLLSHARALLMPGIEDFGITALESLNQHTPVVIHHQSGVAELIIEEKMGIHLQDLTVNDLMRAIRQIESGDFSREAMKQVIKEHTTAAFKTRFKEVVTTLWREQYVKLS